MDERRYYLKTFGDLELLDADGNAVSCPERALLILAYLRAGDRQDQPRDVLAKLLWPDVELGTAYKNLRSTLWRLRAVIADDRTAPLVWDEQRVRIAADKLDSDLDRLDSPQDPFAALATLMEITREGFLARVDVPAGAMTTWLAAQRSGFEERLRHVLLAVLPQARSAPQMEAIKAAAIHLLEKDPRDEDVRAVLHKASEDGSPGLVRRIRAELRGPDYAAENRRQGDPAQRHAAAAPPDMGDEALRAIPRVALLPPETIGGGFLQGAIATALIEDVTIGLCSLRSMAVVAPYTAERIRNAPDKAATLMQHSVTYALFTRLSQNGLFAQLVFLPSDEVIWAERFPLSSEALATQRVEVALYVTRSVAQQIEQNQQATQDYQAHPEAYYTYLLGAQHLSDLSLQQVRRARRQFRDALKFNPDFVPALSGMARTFTMEWLLTARGDQQLLKLAEHHAREAISRGAGEAGGHRELGVTKLYLGQLDESLDALGLAENLSPHHADILYSHADTLVHISRPGDALTKLEKAISLNPLAPDAYLWSAAGAAFFLGRFEEALKYVQAMKDKDPAERLAAASWAMLGNRRKAQVHRARAQKANPSFDIETWLTVVPIKEQWQKELYREGLRKAGF